IAFEIGTSKCLGKDQLLKEKRGLGDCPQGFDFVFEFKQKGFHTLLLNLFLILFKSKSKFKGEE
ncbi:MAG TPA: hypothetical protein DCS88_07135, partial [Alphaproteobacteria bacterium]|nr:hypothetical protein [Alphaproteobacteria bacterium]